MKLNKWIVFSSMGFESLVMVLGGLWVGGEADKRLGWQGLGAVIGAAVGVGIWFYHLVFVLNKISRADERSSGESD